MRERARTLLAACLIMALAIRLIYGLTQDPLAPYIRSGGDSWWYLVNGDALVNGRTPDELSVDLSALPAPPGYLVFLGIAQAIFSPSAEAVIAVRVIQAVMGTVICWCGWRLAIRLTGRASTGLLAAFVLTISPIFIYEPAQLYSETLYMFFFACGLVAYVESIFAASQVSVRSFYALLALSAVLFGLAALTRAPILLFPVGLAIHLLIVYGLRAGWRRALVLLLVYAAVVSTWTIYNLARWNRFVIAGDGLASFFYIGAAGWESPQSVDERMGSTEGGASGEAFLAAAGDSIGTDLLGYIRRRVTELAESVLQPHGTVYFPGESLRELALRWVREDRTWEGLLRLIRGDSFGQKALLYLFHYGALIVGGIGIWRTRRNWRVSLVLIGFITYTLLVHLLLLALPRYIFPTFICWVVFAAAAVRPEKLPEKKEVST